MVTLVSDNLFEERNISRGICAIRGTVDTDKFLIVGMLIRPSILEITKKYKVCSLLPANNVNLQRILSSSTH